MDDLLKTEEAHAAPSSEAAARAAPLFARLDELGIRTETRWHAPVFTVEESRGLRGTIEGAHTKNLFLKDKKGRFFLLVCDEASDIDLKTLHRLIGGSGRLSFAGPDAMASNLGVAPGSVTAFAVMNDRGGRVALVLDGALLAYDVINYHPLTNEATTSIGRDDLLTFFTLSGHRPLIVDFKGAAMSGIDNGQVS